MMRFCSLSLFALCASFVAADASDNGAHDYLLSLPSKGQAEMLAKVAGEGCVGKRAFYKGSGTTGISKGSAFWNVECTNGRAFEVMVNPDGSSKVLDCKVLAATGASQCFQKFKP